MLETGDHCNVTELMFFLISVGMSGCGESEPSPVVIDEKFFTTARNLQLAIQVAEVF